MWCSLLALYCKWNEYSGEGVLHVQDLQAQSATQGASVLEAQALSVVPCKDLLPRRWEFAKGEPEELAEEEANANQDVTSSSDLLTSKIIILANILLYTIVH